jgi:hypothetical protein
LEQRILVQKWFSEIINPLKTDEVVSKLIDYYSHWLILRLKQKTTYRACFEAVMVPKETLESWLEKEKKKVHPHIYK